jgi:hypothetical protein
MVATRPAINKNDTNFFMLIIGFNWLTEGKSTKIVLQYLFVKKIFYLCNNKYARGFNIPNNNQNLKNMKKFSIAIMALALSVSAVFYTGCNSEDTTAPVITLQGDASMDHILNADFTDPGYTALDDEDGDLTSSVTVDLSEFNEDETGTYTIAYSVSDAAGNVGTATRTVMVKNEAASLAGAYAVAGSDGTNTWTYTDNITASSTNNNRIWVARIGNYNNGAVYFNVSGNNISIPMQTVNCGNPAANRTFSGQGGIAGSVITIDYIENTGGTAINVQEIYTKQ